MCLLYMQGAVNICPESIAAAPLGADTLTCALHVAELPAASTASILM